MDELEDGYACGLDLGTTFSCIGVFKNGGVEIIPNRNGDKITPSIVTILDENTILRGEETLENLVKNYDSSIYAIKRFIGRNFDDPKIKEEIEFENFPFNIIQVKEKRSNRLKVEINKKNKDGENIKFYLEEISSFIIKKMVENAQEYLDRKIKKLVITVPANFSDTQRNSTRQAAELAGIEVLRIINEPTAAALAYGLQKTDNEEEKDGKILIFDLGGGTFDVTILKINQKNESKNKGQIFEVISKSGDKFLGGEDFDKILVEFVLDKFCKDNNESKEEIKKNKKEAIKKLKISCENIKKVLSYNDNTTLYISHFYKDKDINQKITQKEFEYLCDNLYIRIEKPLEDALADAKLTKNEIKQIILVGGSTRIPKIKKFLKKYFPCSKINDSINPDETVAYGATLMAAKIIIKDKFTSKFNLMDIIPFSLGTNVMNKSENEEIKKEGDVMSVIIKRGTNIPMTNTQTYSTVSDNQTSISVDIYEGEKKYVKYNHLLKKAVLEGLTPKPAGKVKIELKLFIDVNGILTVTAKEVGREEKDDNKLEFQIKNDGINLTEEEMILLKKKIDKYVTNRTSRSSHDFYNLKETLKEYQDAYNETDEKEEKFNLLMGYNNTLEEFINKFDKNFDNETMVEKYFIFVKQLFTSYINIFNMKDIIDKSFDKGEQLKINKNIKKYVNDFIVLSSGYLDDLMEILKDLPKKIFYEIVVSTIEEFNKLGKNCLIERQKFSRYNSMKYFEKANMLFKKFIIDVKNILKSNCDPAVQKKCKEEMATCTTYLKDINSNIILLCEDALRKKKLIPSHSGFSAFENIFSNEKYQIALETYEKMLPEYRNKNNLEEALILANLIKINYELLGYTNYKLYCKWGEDCEYIANEKLKIDPKVEWYSDFSKTYSSLKNRYHQISDKEIKAKIKAKYEKEFEEIEQKYKKENTQGFINYILKKIPYNGYEEDLEKKTKDFSNVNQDLIFYLADKYHPNHYTLNKDDEKSQLNYCLIEYIDSLLNKLYKNI